MSSPFGRDYPAGAEHDPRAPWNQPGDCETCNGAAHLKCEHCVNGFAEDFSHPTERRLKECEFCEGEGNSVCSDCGGLGREKTRAELRAEWEEAKADMERDDK